MTIKENCYQVKERCFITYFKYWANGEDLKKYVESFFSTLKELNIMITEVHKFDSSRFYYFEGTVRTNNKFFIILSDVLDFDSGFISNKHHYMVEEDYFYNHFQNNLLS